MKIEWNRVTWYSKLSALIVFVVIFPVVTFAIGVQYGMVVEIKRSNIDIKMEKEKDTNKLPAFTSQDLDKGWYWGEQKREGTPRTWVLINKGTRGAKWTAPQL
jgi:hypothetical protein